MHSNFGLGGSAGDDLCRPTIRRLGLAECIAAASYARGEPARIEVRDCLLANLVEAFLEPGGTPASYATTIAADLRRPGRGSGAYGDVLALVCRLSRRQRAPSKDRVEKVIRRMAAGKL